MIVARNNSKMALHLVVLAAVVKGGLGYASTKAH